MIKRQLRILRIVAVAEEYQAASSAVDLLQERLKADPNYGRQHGWRQRAGMELGVNLAGTCVIRVYAEFEAALRDHWVTHRGKTTHPKMSQLVNEAIPDQHFPLDRVDSADDVRKYRNFVVHDVEEKPPVEMTTFTVAETKKHLCAYLACLDPRWK